MAMARAFLLKRPALALAMVLAALCVKLAVPAGFMIRQQAGVIMLEICGGTMSGAAMKHMAMPVQHGDAGSGQHQSQTDCPFASLSMASVGGTDPVLLALALVLIFVLGFAPISRPSRQRLPWLRPPLRGPPAHA
ncbi:MAG: DUF2946 family protein [Sphingomonadales bacterium]|jgi:hypothetical protein